MFNRWAMSSSSLRSFGGVPVLQGNMIRHSISDGLLADPLISAALYVFCALPLLEVGASATGIIFSFRRTVIHWCAGSVLAQVATIVLMLESPCVCVCGKTRIGAGVGRDA